MHDIHGQLDDDTQPTVATRPPPEPTHPTEPGHAAPDTTGRCEEPPAAARTADLGGLLSFLRWMQSNAHRWDKSARTVDNGRSTWRLARERLRLADHTPIADLDPSDVVDRLVAAGCPANTAEVYWSRLAIARTWYRRWQAGEPDWWRRTWLPNPRRRPAAPPSTAVARQFPLRADLVTTVEVPHDLDRHEADLLHAWLLNLVTD
ncbi:hypothetical protein Vau01_095360 [Virgisporangium aurantiacum]|uniref:Uncharacterized protein n=1 Tax=Virgisporangium aurantiacum TaxID=175570 RepID=A0A8J4E4J7_9ACTN|nr:hypothetical protein Vau01_095360 [Virgisporangium aurantiacum]